LLVPEVPGEKKPELIINNQCYLQFKCSRQKKLLIDHFEQKF